MDIKVNKDSPTGTGANIDKKEVSTTVHMKSGETIVIGGVYTKDKRNTTNGVPGLSRIPVLGWLFKNNAKVDTRKELLIFMTPTILNASGKAI
jgi:type IV pilus assembly protein PilQ